MSMISSIISRFRDTERWQKWLGPARNKIVLILAITILYIMIFRTISGRYGVILAPFAAAPVILAGWFFGRRAGVLAGLFSIPAMALLYIVTPSAGWDLWVRTSWAGNIMMVIVGYIAGRLHDEFIEGERMMHELRSRERYLTLIKITISDILGTKTADDRHDFMLTHLSNLFAGDSAYFIRWDATLEQALLTASSAPADRPMLGTVLAPNESALVARALQVGRPLVIDDVAGSQYAIQAGLLSRPPLVTRSLLCVPLITEDFSLGVVFVVFHTLRNFTPEEIERAHQAGDQIAIALSLVQQQAESQSRLKEANVLATIGQALSETERVGIETVFQLIADSTRELIPGAEQVVLHSISDTQEFLIPQAIAGFSQPEKKNLNLRMEESIAGQVITTGRGIIISDAETDSRFLNQETAVKFRSLLVVPVQSGDKKLGAISVQSNLPRVFTPEDSKLLGKLGTQAAIALENAHLLENTRQALTESNSLYRITQGLATSLDPQQLIRDTVDLLQKNFGYYHVQIYVADPKTGDFVLHHGSGEIGRTLKKQKHSLRAGEGIVGYTAETGTPFFTNDVDEVLSFVRNPLLPDTKSELTVAIKSGGQLLGLLDIHQIAPASLTPRDVQLVSAVADQLAVMLQKANLYADLQISLQQEKAIRNQLVQNERLAVMGRLLASVAHELNNPLQAIQNALFLLREEVGISEQGRQDLEIVLAESERMAGLIERLRDTYRPMHAEDFQQTQINTLIEDVFALITTHLRHHKIAFDFQPEPGLPDILGLTDQLRQVILNLLMNAVESMNSGGRLAVSTAFLKESRELLLTISDSGPGIDPSILPYIFDAFITTKQKGTGLGLAISYDIVSKHRGRITAQNNLDQGATFKIWLPLENRELA